MIKIAVCDNEPLMAQELAGHLASYMGEHSITAYSVSSFSGGRALLESGGGFDVIFLDIQMEQPDGMETARLLRRRGDHSLLVFVTVLLFPGLFFFASELYILHTAYSFAAPVTSLEEVGKHSTLLFLQVMGLAALLCTLYAYRQLRQGFQAQAELQSLTQAAHAQKVYITEAQARYEQTKSFRHDIKNHLSVLDGLLKSGKLEESREYLKKLETVSEALSFPYQTGNPVVDILLGEKLGLAKEIAAEVSLLLPKPCGIDDFDLCVLFANALDNAITACRSNDGAKSIRIRGKQQRDFYMLTFENTCSDDPLPLAGTGLSNIEAVAERNLYVEDDLILIDGLTYTVSRSWRSENPHGGRSALTPGIRGSGTDTSPQGGHRGSKRQSRQELRRGPPLRSLLFKSAHWDTPVVLTVFPSIKIYDMIASSK